jgi:hypothetical protein
METQAQTGPTTEEIIEVIRLGTRNFPGSTFNTIGECEAHYVSELFKRYNSETLTAYNRECKRNDELQAELDRLKGTLGVEAVKQNIELREEVERLKKTILNSDTFKAYEARGEEIELYREALILLHKNCLYQIHVDDIRPTHVPYHLFKKIEDVINNGPSKFQPKKDENNNG